MITPKEKENAENFLLLLSGYLFDLTGTQIRSEITLLNEKGANMKFTSIQDQLDININFAHSAIWQAMESSKGIVPACVWLKSIIKQDYPGLALNDV